MYPHENGFHFSGSALSLKPDTYTKEFIWEIPHFELCIQLLIVQSSKTSNYVRFFSNSEARFSGKYWLVMFPEVSNQKINADYRWLKKSLFGLQIKGLFFQRIRRSFFFRYTNYVSVNKILISPKKSRQNPSSGTKSFYLKHPEYGFSSKTWWLEVSKIDIELVLYQFTT